jgi:hypothetical protein
VSISRLRSSVVFADQIFAALNFDAKGIGVEKLEFRYKEEEIQVNRPAMVFRLSDNQFLPHNLDFTVKNLSLGNVLRFLGPQLRPLKGRLNGNGSLSMRGYDLFIKPADGFSVKNLGLVVGPSKDPFTVLMVEKADLASAEIGIINKEFQLNSNVKFANSAFDVAGFVNAKDVRFSVIDAKVDYADLGNIANLDIKGAGIIDVNVKGPLKDTAIHIKGLSQGFEILGFKLGEVEKDLSISLKDDNVIINRMEGLVGQTQLSGSGAVNYSSLDIALGINSSYARSQDLKQILRPILKDLDFLPDDLSFSAKIDAGIHGQARIPDLKVRSNVAFRDLMAYGESLDEGQLRVQFADENLSLNNLQAKKGPGRLTGDFAFSLPRKRLKLDYQWEKFSLASFNTVKSNNLNFDGKLAGSLKGEGPLSDYSLKLDTRLTNTVSHTFSFEDSKLGVEITPNRLVGSGNLLGKIFSTTFDYSLNGKRLSEFDLDIDIPNIKPLGVALIGQHLSNEDFSGKFSFGLRTSFRQQLKDLNLSGHLRELALQYSDININYFSTEPSLVIVDNDIKKWELNVRQPDLYFTSTGSGKVGKSSTISHEFHFNAKLLELLVAPVLSAEGFARNVLRVEGRGDQFDFTASSTGRDITLSIDHLPFPLNDLRYSLEYYGNNLLIKDVTTSLESGTISLKGDVFFEGKDPDVNIKYVIDRAEIPVLGKSVINVSGEGIILGNDRPYNLSGELLLNKAQVMNELSEFNTKGTALSQIRFLPRNQESALGKLLNLNVNVKAENNIRISNSLMDVSLRGEVRLTGNPSRPKAEGRLFSPLNASRVYFKNNEYVITSGDVSFSPRKEITNPDFDVQAQTLITSYKVHAKAYGDLERFNFDLTSEPALSRNSILSLIAFGYTDEIQSTLTQDQQQSLTQAGMGSFVFDRFKISDILNRQFGLQVNLGSVFEQSQSESLLSGRSQEGQGLSGGLMGRTRSATKIELKKRLNEATSLSVSSTMGGDIGQRQSMNLNYSLSRKVQVEGVYEVRTNVDGVEDVIDNSIGADVKFRWTFK